MEDSPASYRALGVAARLALDTARSVLAVRHVHQLVELSGTGPWQVRMSLQALTMPDRRPHAIQGFEPLPGPPNASASVVR